MNTALVTTGLVPLTVASVETFQLQAYKDGLPWDLTGGTVTLKMTDPVGVNYSFAATVQGGGAVYQWTVALPVGTWTRAWVVTDAVGVKQVTQPITFNVVSSPS